MATKYTKKGSTAQYIAGRVPQFDEPFPSWFSVAERAGYLRWDIEGSLEVKIITGAWWRAEPGDWVVMQRGFGCYLMNDEDFKRGFVEC